MTAVSTFALVIVIVCLMILWLHAERRLDKANARVAIMRQRLLDNLECFDQTTTLLEKLRVYLICLQEIQNAANNGAMSGVCETQRQDRGQADCRTGTRRRAKRVGRD